MGVCLGRLACDLQRCSHGWQCSIRFTDEPSHHPGRFVARASLSAEEHNTMGDSQSRPKRRDRLSLRQSETLMDCEVVRSLVVAGMMFTAIGCDGSRPALDEKIKTASATKSDRAIALPNEHRAWSRECRFGVSWPPRKPTDDLADSLLSGELSAFQLPGDSDTRTVRLRLTLRRSDNEADRQRWNKSLAFPAIPWMVHVKVWDKANKWLWPNLPYLLRAHGQERVDRYGGIDPEKDVDNDFAAVLIRQLPAQDKPSTSGNQPLVSAEWYPVGMPPVDRRSVVHVARSDEFRVHCSEEGRAGRLGIWLIYADFMGAPVPKQWPKAREYGGGILAYFEAEWSQDASEVSLKLQHLIPPASTGFDWEEWSTGPKALRKRLELTLPQ